MKNLKLLSKSLLVVIALSSTFSANAQITKKLLSKFEIAPPEEGEAIIKMYKDKERTQEIKAMEDGMMQVYFRCYLWKERTKRGDSPYVPMTNEYCFDFIEGEYELKQSYSGFDYGDVDGKVDAKSMKDYAASNDYIDIDIDLTDKQFLDYFVRDAEAGKKYKFTARLRGECKFPLASTVFEIDLSNGKTKYEDLLLASNDDIEMPKDLFAHDANLNAKTKQLLQITFNTEEIGDVAFYTNWETTSNHLSRYIQCAFTSTENGKCYISYCRVWADRTDNGWLDPSVANQRSMNQVSCSKLE